MRYGIVLSSLCCPPCQKSAMVDLPDMIVVRDLCIQHSYLDVEDARYVDMQLISVKHV